MVAAVRSDLEKMREQLESVLPRHMDPERFIRVATNAILKDPRVLECSKLSIMQSIVQAAQLGLEPTSLLGSAYIVPYRDKGVLTAHLIPGYRGLIDLAKRSQEVEAVSAQIVRAKDYFRIRQGTDPGIDHEPWIAPAGSKDEEADPGPIIGAYMVAVLRDRSGQAGIRQTEWMSIEQIEAVRKRSRAATDGPWVTDYSEMCRKTVVRRGAKYLPLTPEAVQGFSLDEEAERYADDPRAGVTRESSRSRLLGALAARRGIAGENGGEVVAVQDGPGASTDGQVGDPSSPGGSVASEGSGEVVDGVAKDAPPETQASCGEAAGPESVMAGAVCSLPAGHPGAHKAENGSWPR
jgi:recombination protein RecT